MGKLKGLDKFCGQINIGGLAQIEYAPLDEIDLRLYEPIISQSYNFQTDIVFQSGTWLTVPVVNSKRLWSEELNRTRQGNSYEQQVRGVVPGLSDEAAGELEQMAEHAYLLRLRDRHDRLWLLGTPDSPFYFRSEGSTGGEGAVRGHRIRFFSETPRKAYGFVPVIVP